MISFGAVLFFWGVLLVCVGLPSVIYFCNIDDQRTNDSQRTLLLGCIATGVLMFGIALSVIGLIKLG